MKHQGNQALAMDTMNNNEKDTEVTKALKSRYRTVHMGVWEVLLPIQSSWDFSSFSTTISTYGLIFRLFKDIYSLAPNNFIILILARIARNFESGLLLYIDSQIWDMVCSSTSINQSGEISIS